VNAPAAARLQLLARIDIKVSWQGQHASLTIGGELDWATAPVLTERLTEVMAKQPGQVTLELAHLDFMDCAGVSPIVRARRDLPACCPLVLESPVPRVRKLLAATGIDQLAGLSVSPAGPDDPAQPHDRRSGARPGQASPPGTV
jgi:anti-anti-sigma factor